MTRRMLLKRLGNWLGMMMGILWVICYGGSLVGNKHVMLCFGLDLCISLIHRSCGRCVIYHHIHVLFSEKLLYLEILANSYHVHVLYIVFTFRFCYVCLSGLKNMSKRCIYNVKEIRKITKNSYLRKLFCSLELKMMHQFSQ